MSENWEGCFSDPFEPTFLEPYSSDFDIFEGRGRSFSRCFDCLGDVSVDAIDVHPNGYLCSNEEMLLFSDSTKFVREEDKSGFISLFGQDWECGVAFYKLHPHFFKMLSKEVCMIEEVGLQDIRLLGDETARYKRDETDVYQLRSRCVHFFTFFRNSLIIVLSNNEYSWILKEKIDVFKSHLKTLTRLFERLTRFPQHVFAHSPSSNGNKSREACYHLVHTHLDLRWLHLSCLWLLSPAYSSQTNITHSTLITHNFLIQHLQYLIHELLQLSLKRFEKTDVHYLRHKSPFNCTCVQELLMLIIKMSDKLYAQSKEKTFWDLLSLYLDVGLMLNSEEFEGSSSLHTYSKQNSCKYLIFSFWIIYHVSRLYSHVIQEVNCNYVLLESNLKLLLNSDVNEDLLRVSLFFVEKICLDTWEPRAELLLILWEFFHRKINTTFSLPSSQPSPFTLISKSSIGLLTQLRSFLSDIDSVTNSFQHFLRIIGLHLMKSKANPRHWKLLKGRMYSKLTLPKLETLSNLGEYHFVSLFLILAISQDVSEAGLKLVEILNGYYLKKKWLSEELVKGCLCVGTLLVENDEDASIALQPVSLFLSHVTIYEHPTLIRIYLDTFSYIFSLSKPLSLGQHLLIGKWISDYLSSSSRSDTCRLLDTLSSVLDKLKLYSEYNLPEQNTIVMIEKLWDELKNYLECCVMEQETPHQVSHIAASLAAIFLQHSNNQRFIDIVNIFVNRNITDVSVLRQFVCNISKNGATKDVLPNYDEIILKTWLKCMFMCCNAEEEMQELTKIMLSSKEIVNLFPETPLSLLRSSQPLRDFCSLLHSKYLLEDLQRRQKLREKFQSYLDGVEKWIKPIISPPRNPTRILSLYNSASYIVRFNSPLIYIKSRPNNILQKIVDVLLLPISVRNPETKLNPHILSAIKASLHFFIQGLLYLEPGSDPYIGRVIKELLVIYIPHCINSQNQNLSSSSEFTLISYFSNFDFPSRKILFEVLMNGFFKRKSKSSHPSAILALKFVSELVTTHRDKEDMIRCIVSCVFGRLCDVVMYCDEKAPVNITAKQIIKLILNSQHLRDSQPVSDNLMGVLKGLCEEELAWSSRQLFDLLVLMTEDAPDLIRRFTPTLLHQVQLVEAKRGVPYDRSLRLGIERIEMNLRAIKGAL